LKNKKGKSIKNMREETVTRNRIQEPWDRLFKISFEIKTE